MSNYVKAADAIIAAFNCAVIVVHHCGIEGTRPRGHTSLTGAADAQLAVKRNADGNVTTKLEWLKDGPEGEEICSRLEPVDVATDEDGETITSCVVVEAEPSKDEKPLRGYAKTAYDALAKVADDATLAAQANSENDDQELRTAHKERTSRHVRIEVWKTEFEAQCVDAANITNAAMRMRFNRAVETLKSRNLVGFRKDEAWLIW
jgi:hypothetical protein